MPDEAAVCHRIGAGPLSCDYPIDVCPGWLVRQPAVRDAAEAAIALEHSELERAFPDDEGPVLEAAMLVLRARSQYEAAEMRSKQPPEGGTSG